MPWLTSFQLTFDAIIEIKHVKHGLILDISYILRLSSLTWNPRPLGILKELLSIFNISIFNISKIPIEMIYFLFLTPC